MTLTVLAGVFLAAVRVWMAATAPDPSFLLDSYKAMAHVYMGGLLVSAWIRGHRWQWVLFWLLCAVEVGAVIVSKVF